MNGPKLIIYHPVLGILTDKHIHTQLVSSDTKLNILFDTIDINSFEGLPKPPYVALIGAVIGQIIRYVQAKSVRSGLYRLCGNNFGIDMISNLTVDQWNSIGLSQDKLDIIYRLNTYITNNSLSLDTVNSINKLKNVMLRVLVIGPLRLLF